MEIDSKVHETYIATKDGRITFDVPSGTETIEKIVVGGKVLQPGIDYLVAFRRGPSKRFPETFTLKAAPEPGANINVTGIIWKKGRNRPRTQS